MNHILTIEGNQFLRNEEPHRIFSGALHYFRILPEYWEDRLRKCKACGLNTIETYTAWNLHEPRKGVFDFEGRLDVRKFVQLAGDIGLDVIFRPGPFICAEWEFGGFPAWLLADRNMRLRCANPAYLLHVEDYFKRLLAEVHDLQATNGGPIIAMQIENEYGSYGNDKEYLSWLENTLKDNGVDVLLFTSDGPDARQLDGGLPHILKTANFGSNAKECFDHLREHQPEGPLMCMEFWNGWFDHWGFEHHTREPQVAAKELEELLACGASVNIYMMHGGSNFGFLNGANFQEEYRPTVSSYDYDAPLDEQGNPTEKYRLFREILAKHGAMVEPVPASVSATALGEFSVTASAPLFENLEQLGQPLKSAFPLTMEDVGQNYGFILYRTRISGPRAEAKLFIQEVHDRAQVFLNGKMVGIINRNEKQEGLMLQFQEEEAVLDILVENLGRVNYGLHLHDRKGITDNARLQNLILHQWEIYPLELTSVKSLSWKAPATNGSPTFHRVDIQIKEPTDTFLTIPQGVHGAVWVNGFALGRYWNIGPQKSLFVPGSLLRDGDNEILLLELESGQVPGLFFGDKALLG